MKAWIYLINASNEVVLATADTSNLVPVLVQVHQRM